MKNRFISNFLTEETIIEETTVLIKIENETIEIKGNVIVKEGFLKYENDMDSKQSLPKFIENEELNCIFEVDKKETQKPKKATEADLNNFLKNPFKKQEIDELDNDDDAYKDILAGVEIGTVATRASIIENAKKYEYIKSDKNSLICNLKGLELIDILDKLDINMSKEKTVEVGKELKQIYKNEIKIEDIIDKVKKELFEVINKNVEIEKIIIEKESLGKCPICGKGEIVSHKLGFGCNHWKEGCKFFISNKIAGKTISEVVVKKLLKDGKSSLIKGFKSKNDKEFDACLVLNGEKLSFGFNNENQSLGKCPVCGKGEVVSNKSGFGCNHWKEGCKFFISNKIAGKTISEAVVKKLLKDGKSNLIKGFKSKNNKEFDAFLNINDGEVKFAFQK